MTMIKNKMEQVAELFGKNWRNKEPTQKQLNFIAEMQEFSEYPLPLFTGSTRGDAYDYIQKYGELFHESTWAMEHGY